MERPAALALLAGAALTAPATAQIVPVPAAAPVTDELAIGEADLRMTVPVSIADKGTWPFVIDTGAERTVVSNELARHLDLAPGRPVRVMTMAGSVAAATARVPMLRLKSLAPDLIEAPTFARVHLGAIGMLGIDALQGHRIAIDFVRDTMTLTPSRKRAVPRRAMSPDEIVVVARSLYGQLIVTDAHWRGRRIAVVVDTGSPVTIANPALLRIAGDTPPPLLGRIGVTTPSGAILGADAYRLDRLEIGAIGFSGVMVAVADAAPFARFGLSETPALLLGMETLRLFRAVEIDFANRTIRLTLPRGARVSGAAIKRF